MNALELVQTMSRAGQRGHSTKALSYTLRGFVRVALTYFGGQRMRRLFLVMSDFCSVFEDQGARTNARAKIGSVAFSVPAHGTKTTYIRGRRFAVLTLRREAKRFTVQLMTAISLTDHIKKSEVANLRLRRKGVVGEQCCKGSPV